LLACATFALLLFAHASQAATIIKLDLGGVGPDINHSGGVFGQLETVDDNPAGLTGDQAGAGCIPARTLLLGHSDVASTALET
jgi:hypothetical protein